MELNQYFKERQSAARHLSKNAPVCIYGAGNFGQSLAKKLLNEGYTIECFIDQRAPKLQECMGIPVRPIPEKDQQNKQIVIGVFNRDVSPVKITELLTKLGFTVFNNTELSYTLPNLKIESMWLDPKMDYQDFQEGISDARKLLSDDESRRLYDDLMAYRITGNTSYCPLGVGLQNQYFDETVPGWLKADQLHMVDCGAFDGDTVKIALDKSTKLKSVIALEPDFENLKKLSHYLRSIESLESTIFPCGVWSSSTTLKFSSGQGEGSRIGETGTYITVVKLDDVLVNHKKINFVKMDIEGAELDAIAGMVDLVGRQKPYLAISLYHCPKDLWEIPLSINRLHSGYKYYIRQHGENAIDSVLYCVPV